MFRIIFSSHFFTNISFFSQKYFYILKFFLYRNRKSYKNEEGAVSMNYYEMKDDFVCLCIYWKVSTLWHFIGATRPTILFHEGG